MAGDAGSTKAPASRCGARLTPSRLSPLAPPNHGGRTEGPGKDIEAALHRFTDEQAARRWDLEDQAVPFATEPHLGQEIDGAAAQGIGETERKTEGSHLRGGSLVEQLASRVLDGVVCCAAVANMQHRRDKYPVGMADAGKRHPQATGKSEFGAVVGVLAPGNVAQPAGGSMESTCSLRRTREQRRRPFLKSVALEVEAALGSG